MASVSVTLPPSPFATAIRQSLRGSDSFFKPLQVRPSKNAVGFLQPKSRARRLEVKASLEEKAMNTVLTAASFTAYMSAIPEVAESAGSGVSPSLKSFLLSIAAGGIVVGVIVGAVIAVANFDPVKRK